MPTALEKFTAEVNKNFFLKEFSFDKNKFRAACGSEFELADHVISLPNETFVFQIKERDPNAASDRDSMLKWFKKKVIQVGCGQLRDSEKYLTEQPALLVENQRGHRFDLANRCNQITKILLYSSTTDILSESDPLLRYKISKRAGFIHVLDIKDYYQLCRCLAAPKEISEYFSFRQKYWESAAENIPEEAMLAAMFIEESLAPLSPADARQLLDKALLDVPSFDLGPILRPYAEKIVNEGAREENLQYYRILEVFLRLNRAELRGLKSLFQWALERAGDEKLEIPCRMRGGSQTGFVVFPVPAKGYQRRLNALMNFTHYLKYDWKLDRALGVSFSRDNDIIQIDWCLVGSPWEYDFQMERKLEENYPFHPTPDLETHFRFPG